MKKIAIVRRNGLGDLLCSWPLVEFLKKRGDQVTLFLSKSNAPLIPYLSPGQEIVVLPTGGNKYISHFFTALRYRKKFDLAISAKTSPMKLMNFFLFTLGAKERIAYVKKQRGGYFVNRPIFFEKSVSKGQHQALKCLKTVAPDMEKVPVDLYPHLKMPLFKKHHDGLMILVNASTTREQSRLNEQLYAGFLNRLYKEGPFQVKIIGLKNDEGRAFAIKHYLRMPSDVHFPRNFEDFMLTLHSCDLFFVPDGGVAHIGAAMEKKGVILYGETNPVEWGPLSQEMETVYHPQHVNNIQEDIIESALKRKFNEVICARNDLRSKT